MHACGVQMSPIFDGNTVLLMDVVHRSDGRCLTGIEKDEVSVYQ